MPMFSILRCLWFLVFAGSLFAASYHPPAGTRKAARRPGSESVLPGGRTISPLGQHYSTGPGPFGLAVSPDGRLAVTANGGPNRYSITLLDRSAKPPQVRQVVARGKAKDRDEDDDAEWEGVFPGLAFLDNTSLVVSEGNTGRVRMVSLPAGKRRERFDLNQNPWKDSYAGDVAVDPERRLLYVLDQANFRMAIFDLQTGGMIASVPVGRLPFRLALSPDGRQVYVTNVGMFEYKVVPGADPKQALETGLPFPAFGFPSRESAQGVRRETAAGPVDVPALGDPNVAESNSVCVIDVADPRKPKVLRFIRTGKPFGSQSNGGSSPSGILLTASAIYVANANQDTITVIDPMALENRGEIELRIPGLESLRGVLPLGMAYVPERDWVLVAEAGINAIGVVDARTRKLIGHLPAAWFPTAVSLFGNTVFVSSAKGHGTGPNATRTAPLERSFQAELRNGDLSVFSLPSPAELAANTRAVMERNGLVPSKEAEPKYPEAIKYVVVIVKENRTYDEVFGDVGTASNGPVTGAPELARFGQRGWVTWDRGNLTARLQKRYYDLSPNHREMARRWAFSDNFYVDSEISVDGHHWVVGSYPNAWTETTLRGAYGGQKDFRMGNGAPGRLLFAGSNSSVHPEEQLEHGAIWHHLDRHGVTFRNFGEGFELAGADEGAGLKPTGARYLTNVPMPDPLFRNTSREYPNYNTNIPDQFRANQFIKEMDELYVKPGKDLPRLLFIHLPNDHMARPRPEDGYPFEASYMLDNDYALGRMMEYLTNSKWWPNMAVFVTEDDAQGGVDHIDSHRTVFLVASPYAKKNYCSHVNASFPAMLKSVFGILGIPPLNLFDASAASLHDMFTDKPDLEPFKVQPVPADVFVPGRAKDPLDPKPGPAMDDPRFLREQHRQRQ